jgi:hypothetical protein
MIVIGVRCALPWGFHTVFALEPRRGEKVGAMSCHPAGLDNPVVRTFPSVLDRPADASFNLVFEARS